MGLIAIRNRVRYHFRMIFSGASISIDRYELELDPSVWMFVARDAATGDEIEADGEDALALEAALRKLEKREIQPHVVEDMLAAWFADSRGR